MVKASSAKSVRENGTPAEKINVAQFRQIHHLPLVWQGGDFDRGIIANDLETNGWFRVADPIRALSDDRENPDPDAFNEVVYFHDFARDFLYPQGENPSFCLFEKRNPGGITAKFGKDPALHKFEIIRLTLHVFRTKTAILTVETEHVAGESPLNLAQVQTIIDYFRRSYTPYWVDGAPGAVPSGLKLSGRKEAAPQVQKDMIEFFENNRESGADAQLLEPWKSWIAPLRQKDWRDPSDERVPAMSFILLEKTKKTNRDTLNQVRENDWYRLAEADVCGEQFAYNPNFLARMDKRYFYDRFMPDEKMDDDIATRHIFGGAHYSLVSIDGWFTQNIIVNHFRRHYEKMALTVRFEFTSLLAFSSRVSQAVKPLEQDNVSAKTTAKTREKFRREILTIHEDFLEFTHRYRFTGISSQIQAGEMYDHWRASLDLDRLYADVKEEITSASEYSQATLADKKSVEANAIAWAALFIASLFAVPTLNDIPLIMDCNTKLTTFLVDLGLTGAGKWVALALPLSIAAICSWLVYRFIWWLKKRT